MDKKATGNIKIIGRLIFTPIFFGAPLFLSAGTLHYWQGWLFLIVFMACTIWLSIDMMKNDPALLERRMRAGPKAERRPVQRLIMFCMISAWMMILIISGLDFKNDWSQLPIPAVLFGDLLIILSYVVFFFVCRQNTFASATIELAKDQKVISTGLYGVVRHPMYMGGTIFLIGIPLALGSLWAMSVVVAIMPVLIWRIVDEEKMLRESLDGYAEYCNKVKYRIIPRVY